MLGHPVLYYPANAATKSKLIQKFFCSSDDEKILNEAEKLNYIPIKRPPELAQPDSQHIDCILHALEVIGKNFEIPEILVVILANNVTVKSQYINDCVNILLDDPEISAAVPVYVDNDHHPLRAKTVDENNKLQMYEKNITGKISTNRQDLPKCYFLSHNFWVLRTSNFTEENILNGQQPWSFMGNNIAYYEIGESIDIHKETDLILAREWIKKNYTD